MNRSQPFFSIVVPTYARPVQLAACLLSLARLDYPRDRFEVIVVDDGGDERLEMIVAPLRDRINVSLLNQANAGPASARNTGAENAKGELLVFTDDDCAPAPLWLQCLASRFAIFPECVIGGSAINTLDNIYSTASQFLVDYLYSYYNKDQYEARFLTSNNLALPADSFREMGGFDNSFPLAAGEDRDFCSRWTGRGKRIIYVPEAVVRHSHSLTFGAFCKQHFNYGRGAFHFHEARAKRNEERIKVEPLSFYLDLIRYPFTLRRGWQALSLTALLMLTQAANAWGFFREKLIKTQKDTIRN
ncbi:Glycosyl transferase, group 2 family protein [hydrothermal vent metagenome]|uniref:Glycosyl transferase, group 2 family protein n=1 Tax=hydrothermal vent metagenome TaxID=652676 RepID=A0A3B1CB66_9ZZZZ